MTGSAAEKRASVRIHPMRDAVLAAGAVLAVALVGLGLSYRAARQAQIQAVQTELRQLAALLAVQIDGDLHRTIVSEEQSGSPEHLRALAPIGRFLRASKDIIYAYTAVLQEDEIRFILNGSFVYRIEGDTLPPDKIGEPYVGADPEFRQALIERRATVNAEIIRESSRRGYMSAYAPFHDSRGEFVGVVGVDMWTRDLEARLARMQRALAISAAAVALLAGGIGAVVGRLRSQAAHHERALAKALVDARTARQAAEQASELKTRLVGIASHDLKSPLRAIIGCASAIAREPDERVSVVDLAQRIENNGQRMFTLIRDLLDMAALEAGRLDLQRTAIRPATLARDVVEALRTRAVEKRQRLEYTVESGAEAIEFSADAARLRQAVENLVDNALKFTPADRAIRVKVSATGGFAAIAVEDQGPGLTPDDYAQLFQPFKTLSATPTAGEPSSGLGLSIAREIVALHGGHLTVESIPGEGATFTIQLPVSNAMEHAPG